jgi:hypothetical protein
MMISWERKGREGEAEGERVGDTVARRR